MHTHHLFNELATPPPALSANFDSYLIDLPGPAFEERLMRLDRQFADAVHGLHERLESLLACEPFSHPEMRRLRNMPAAGVYLFSEADEYLYVGRTDRLRGRLGEHCRPGSSRFDATFAFKLAKSDEVAALGALPAEGGKAVEKHEAFVPFFLAAKARVKAMTIRYVEEPDSLRQALLEIYCSVALDTPWNDFDNH